MEPNRHANPSEDASSRRIFTFADLRDCCMRDYASGALGMTTHEAARNAAQRIEELDLWPRNAREWSTEWGRFVLCLAPLFDWGSLVLEVHRKALAVAAMHGGERISLSGNQALEHGRAV